jgi:membrane fusion protein, multidrug efflux system
MSEPEEEKDLEVSKETPGDEKKKSRLPAIIVGSIILIGAIAGTFWWLYARQFETTDDAFLEGNISQVSAKISAHIQKLHVKENQIVKKGDLLVELDSGDLVSKLEQTKANLKSAIAIRDKAKANASLVKQTGKTDFDEAGYNLGTAKTKIQTKNLNASSKLTDIEKAKRKLQTVDANLKRVQSQLPSAEAVLEQAKAQIPDAKTILQLAIAENERKQRLYESGDIPKKELEVAAKELSAARAENITKQKQVDIAQSDITSLRKQIDIERAILKEAETDIKIAENQYNQSLAEVETVKSESNESLGRLEATKSYPEKIAIEESEIGAAEARITEAEAAVSQAELELSYAKIYAPQDGFVVRNVVQEGSLVQPDQSLMAITQNEIWVIANFKETQLERIKIGQIVEIRIDAYPNSVFYGKLDSFQAATGGRMSILPADNATGGFVKVVQRVPIKIVFDEIPDKKYFLVPGMSAVPKVHIR